MLWSRRDYYFSRLAFSRLLLLTLTTIIATPFTTTGANTGSRLRGSNEINNNDTTAPLLYSQELLYDVIIVGAGWAGLGAANHLHNHGTENNNKKFLVLESSDNVGGRCKTDYSIWDDEDDSSNIPIELGCQFMHGIRDNRIFDFVVKNGNIPYEKVGKGDMLSFYSDGGGKVPDITFQNLLRELYDGPGGFYNFQERLQYVDTNDVSLRSIADEYIKKKKQQQQLLLSTTEDKKLKKEAFELFLSTFISMEYAASLDDLSHFYWNSGRYLSGPDAILDRGYGSVLQSYARPVLSNILFNATVTDINYASSSDSDIVTTVNYKDNYGRQSTMELHAKHVIVTVPVSILQRGMINFTPRLPNWKREAISRIGVGLMNKIILFWKKEHVFWPKKNNDWLVEMMSDTTTSIQIEFFNPYAYNGGKPILYGFVTGDHAKTLEQSSRSDDYENEFTTIAMSSLKRMFGSSVPMPDKVIVTKWGNDPLAYGSYSYAKVGFKPNDRENLGRHIDKKLIFAGEASSLSYPATAHGALLEGEYAASLTISWLRPNNTRAIVIMTMTAIISLVVIIVYCTRKNKQII